MDLNKYDLFIVTYDSVLASKYYASDIVLKGITNTLFKTHHSTDTSRRKITIDNNGFTFDDATFISTAGGATNTDNTRNVPIKIFGIRL